MSAEPRPHSLLASSGASGGAGLQVAMQDVIQVAGHPSGVGRIGARVRAAEDPRVRVVACTGEQEQVLLEQTAP